MWNLCDMTSQEKIAKILRADKDYISHIDARLSEVTGKTGVCDALVRENDAQVAAHIKRIGVSRGAGAKAVYEALIRRIEEDDVALAKAFGNPVCDSPEDCTGVVDIVRDVVAPPKGFFLKPEKAREFLVREPPRKVMKYLKYDDPVKMFEKEDLFEVFSALRFVEGSEWLNGTFFKQYHMLSPDDFEEREVRVHVLDPKWVGAAEHFMQKKWHNISHLKELGVVFVIPKTLGIPGELLRMISLIFHYLHEVSFYSDMFRKIAGDRNTFSYYLISLLRGDVIDRPVISDDRSPWLVVQRYLAKDDPYDWRLYVPHLNPEALHWARAERDFSKLTLFRQQFRGLRDQLSFWVDLDWVGDFFKDDVGNDTLVSFDLVDTVMSLVKEREMTKFLYHHQEALWNRLFVGYFGEEKLEEYCKEYLLQGYFEV